VFAVDRSFLILAKLNQFTIFMNTFSIRHQLTLKEYRKIVYAILYSKTWIIVINIFSALFIVYSCLMAVMKNYNVFNSIYYSVGVGIAALAI
jgi:hypothetical protein